MGNDRYIHNYMYASGGRGLICPPVWADKFSRSHNEPAKIT